MGRNKIKVAVVFGGRSSEHAISCATAAGVMSALDPQRYEVIPVGIARDGRWLVVSGEAERWTLTADRLPEVTSDAGTVVLPPTTVGDAALTVLTPGELPRQLTEVDVVFPLLHGPYGEDGTVQGLLELSDIRYVGAGVLSSALSMDKHYMKVVLAGAGIPVGPHVAVLPGHWERHGRSIRAKVTEMGYPVFVKPARAGSSMGVSKVTSPDGLNAAVRAASEHDPKVLIERAILGREIECGVLQGLDGGPPEASLPGEIEVTGPGHEFYDFAAKYRDEAGVRLSCPADLPADVTARVQELALATFTAAACEGLARVDCFVTAAGEVLVNELNTMPGFTPYSMFPRMWQCSGMDYPALVDRLIDMALRRPVGLR